MLRRRKKVNIVTLSEALAMVQGINPASSSWYQAGVNALIAYAGDVPIGDLTPAVLDEWVRVLQKAESPQSKTGRLSPWTVNSYARAVRAMLGHMVRLKHLDHSPAEELRLTRLPNPEAKDLSVNQLKALDKASRMDRRSRAIYAVLQASGARISDVVSMRISSLEIESRPLEATGELKDVLELVESVGFLHIVKDEFRFRLRGRAFVTGKGQRGRKKARWVFLDHDACLALRAYLATREWSDRDEVFLTKSGRPMKVSTVYDVVKKVAEAAGVEMSPHDLRHTFATRASQAGMNPRDLAEILGHSDPTLTMRQYYNPGPAYLWDLHEGYSGKPGKPGAESGRMS